MNTFTYDEIAIGQTESFMVTVTKEMLTAFGDITGDHNPIHTDAEFAQNVGYKEKIAYGLLTASFLSTVAGVYLPGENSLIHKIEAEFPAPVYAGESLTYTGEVTRKEDTFKVIELKVTARNSSGQKVLRGKMRVGVLK